MFTYFCPNFLAKTVGCIKRHDLIYYYIMITEWKSKRVGGTSAVQGQGDAAKEGSG